MACRAGYLTRRGAIYYHRIAVPKALQVRLGRRELWLSLRTPDLQLAKLRGAIVHLKILEGFEKERGRALMGQNGDGGLSFIEQIRHLALTQLRADISGQPVQLSEGDLRRIVGHFYQGAVANNERRLIEADRGAIDWRAPQYAEIISRLGTEAEAEKYFRDECIVPARYVLLEAAKDDEELYAEALKRHDWEVGQDFAIEVMQDDNLVLHDADYRALCLRLVHVGLEVCRHLIATSEGRFEFQPTSAVVLAGLKQVETESSAVDRPPVAIKPPVNPRRMKLPGEYVEKFVSEKNDAAKKANPKGLSPSFLDEQRDAVRMLQEIYPEKKIGDYTKADIAGFKEMLNITPNRYNMVFKVPLPEAIELNKTAGREAIKPHTRERRLSAVKEFFSWARGADLIDIDPGEGVEFIKTRTRKIGPKRKPFRLGELQKLFASPLFTGCKDERFWKKPGSYSMRDDHRFWLPLLALWTGARQGELAQLLVADVKQVDGIWVIEITDEPDADESPESLEKRVKNNSSNRKVPIHPELIRIGFLKFVERKTEAGARRLFADCERDQNGRFGPHTKHFKYLLVSVGITRQGVSFHSFRHAFEDAMQNSLVDEGAALRITGRLTGTSRDTYGEGAGAKAREHWVRKVKYEGLDLSHLYDSAVNAQDTWEAKS